MKDRNQKKNRIEELKDNIIKFQVYEGLVLESSRRDNPFYIEVARVAREYKLNAYLELYKLLGTGRVYKKEICV